MTAPFCLPIFCFSCFLGWGEKKKRMEEGSARGSDEPESGSRKAHWSSSLSNELLSLSDDRLLLGSSVDEFLPADTTNSGGGGGEAERNVPPPPPTRGGDGLFLQSSFLSADSPNSFPSLVGSASTNSGGGGGQAEQNVPAPVALPISQRLPPGKSLHVPEKYIRKFISWRQNHGRPRWHGIWKNHGCILFCDKLEGHHYQTNIHLYDSASSSSSYYDLYHCTQSRHHDDLERLVFIQVLKHPAIVNGVILFPYLWLN